MNLRLLPSLTIFSRPPSTAISSPPAVKVPQNTTFFAFWVMLMKPPATHRAPAELAHCSTLPWPSVWARPRKATSMPPPS